MWWVDFEVDKIRPVLVLTRSWVAPQLTRLLAAPITSRIRGIPCEVHLGSSDGLDLECVANFDNIQLIDSDRFLAQAGSMERIRWPEVCAAMAHVIAC
ncbi:MAG TPA: mRNA interferase MazF3 [Acidimicrobiaceae bacterium]|nr:mRNA interferase MazF3 [Acidimicrobiaceae bacterium]